MARSACWVVRSVGCGCAGLHIQRATSCTGTHPMGVLVRIERPRHSVCPVYLSTDGIGLCPAVSFHQD
jgi:hypothetical protein